MSSAESLASTLLSRIPPPLCPTRPFDASLKPQIDQLGAPKLVTAALHLANDDIDGCHDIVGDMNSETAKVLHATLHRREGDYWNAKYWWNRIRSPLVPSVAIEASFVDQCEKVGKGASKDGALEKRQWEEMGRIVRYVLEHEK